MTNNDIKCVIERWHSEQNIHKDDLEKVICLIDEGVIQRKLLVNCGIFEALDRIKSPSQAIRGKIRKITERFWKFRIIPGPREHENTVVIQERLMDKRVTEMVDLLLPCLECGDEQMEKVS